MDIASIPTQTDHRPPRASTSRRLLEVAAGQYGLVTSRQIREEGFSDGFVRARLASMRILPVQAGLYAVGRPIEGSRAVSMAATMAAGAFLSGMSASSLWGFLDYRGPIHVVRSESRSPSRFRFDSLGVRRGGLVIVHRTRSLPDVDVTTRFGIPTLAPERTLLGLAAELDQRRYHRTFAEADRLGLLAKDRLMSCVSRSNGRKGAALFRREVERLHPDAADARSLLEVLFLELCERFHLGRPVVNRPAAGRYYPDFRWPDLKLIVEVDGYEGHAGRAAFLDDAHRENALRADGYQVIRFTWEEVTERPEQVATLVLQEQERCRCLIESGIQLHR